MRNLIPLLIAPIILGAVAPAQTPGTSWAGQVRRSVVLQATEPTSETMTEPVPTATGQVIVTTWRSGGVNRELRTPRLDNEGGPGGIARWQSRHLDAERGAFVLWPPDP